MTTPRRAPMARPLTPAERRALLAHPEVCPVCRVARPRDSHPCRFELACSCWRGLECRPDGDPRD